MNSCHIRTARPEDADELLKIYAPYVENTAITFEYESPSTEDFSRRISHVLQRFPYFIAERGGEILGYAYASTFKERAAYGWAVETSIYVRTDAKGLGIGQQLYTALENALKLQNILNVNACIAYPARRDEYLTKDSERFHRHMGYRLVGKFTNCAYKFGRWYDMIWMEKYIGEHTDTPAPVRSFSEIRGELKEKYAID